MSLISNARHLAESRMVDTWQAKAPGAPTTGADGMKTTPYVDQYVTIGKLRGNSLISHDTAARMVIVGLVERPLLEGAFHIPVDAPLPEIAWQFVCTAVAPTSDPALLGVTLHVVNVPVESFMTARRLDVVRL